MKRASIGLVVLLFVASLVSSAESTSGRTLNAAESAAILGGVGWRCYNGDDNCEGSDKCVDQVDEAGCEVGQEQSELQGPKYKCIAFLDDYTCTLSTVVTCVTAVECKWDEHPQQGEDPAWGECVVDPNSIPWASRGTYQECQNGVQ